MNDELVNSTPTEEPGTLSRIINKDNLLDSITVLKLNMIDNLTKLAGDLLIQISNTTNFQLKMQLTKELQKMYTDIRGLTRDVSAAIKKPKPLTIESLPFLDFTRRKSRAQTWKDYVAYCEAENIAPMNKRELFVAINDMGFTTGVTSGDTKLIPPGFRKPRKRR